MYVHIYICVCVYVHMYTILYVYIYVCVCVYVPAVLDLLELHGLLGRVALALCVFSISIVSVAVPQC
jgi:hypothetical protein